jgi:hypothetical protein
VRRGGGADAAGQRVRVEPVASSRSAGGLRASAGDRARRQRAHRAASRGAARRAAQRAHQGEAGVLGRRGRRGQAVSASCTRRTTTARGAADTAVPTRHVGRGAVWD